MTHGPIFLLLQLCNSKLHRYANFQFINFICYYYYHSVLTPQISKTHFPIHLIYVKLNGSDD